ncbi:facilitated trehalose transporter Tret1-like [Adelges cooleyi]|uniref:facilitated trehalose transporter Tret1-like n=1 Tax=Adelges cooleyi TaxID=133065 RepID=UPI0021807F95|nr:facilitated trehalose transporter Tret1-like [Adelges cooleyi]
MVFGEKHPLLANGKLSGKNDSSCRPLLASFVASILSFASGTVVAGWSAPANPSVVGETIFMLTKAESSWVVSIYVIGSLVGALPTGYMSQSIGRKKFLLLLAIPMSLGWALIMAFDDNVNIIYTGRLLCGLAVGAITVAVPLYNQEIASDACRGRGGVFLDFMLCVGILYSYMISAVVGLSMFSLTCSLIPVVFAILFAFMPESPAYLYHAGRYEEARTSLKWLYGEDFDVMAQFDTYAKIRGEIDNASRVASTDINGFYSKRIYAKAIVLSIALVTIQRLSGAGAIIQYIVKLFKISGSSIEPSTASIITGTFQVLASGASILLVDRVGRRKLLLASSSVVVVCLAMLTLYFYCLKIGLLANSFLKIMPVFIVCTYISFFRLGLGPIPWFMTSELLGSERENIAQSILSSYSWTLSFFIMKTFVPFVDNWPIALWLGYTVISVVGFVIILFFIPETNNKNQEQIQQALTKLNQWSS